MYLRAIQIFSLFPITRWILLAGALTCNTALATENTTLRIAFPADLHATDNRHYYHQLLVLAMEKTRKSHGDYTITRNNYNLGAERERAMLIANAGLDVVWGSLTREREQSMQAIPIDLVKNLNSYRILVIKEGTQDLFTQVKTLADFRKLTSGSGINWSHNAILSYNNIRVTTSGSFHGLYKMLAAGRFAYVARAPYEAAAEIDIFNQHGISLDSHLLLKFSNMQSYSFFVRKDDQALAKRIETGLQQAQADGSFDALFLSYPHLKSGLRLISEPTRTTIELASNNVSTNKQPLINTVNTAQSSR